MTWLDESADYSGTHAVVLDGDQVWEPQDGVWHKVNTYLNSRPSKIVYVIAPWVMHSLYGTRDYTTWRLTTWDENCHSQCAQSGGGTPTKGGRERFAATREMTLGVLPIGHPLAFRENPLDNPIPSDTVTPT